MSNKACAEVMYKGRDCRGPNPAAGYDLLYVTLGWCKSSGCIPLGFHGTNACWQNHPIPHCLLFIRPLVCCSSETSSAVIMCPVVVCWYASDDATLCCTGKILSVSVPWKLAVTQHHVGVLGVLCKTSGASLLKNIIYLIVQLELCP